MSAVLKPITLACDTLTCHHIIVTRSHTVAGARGDAERKGWSVAYLAGGMHPTKRSGDPKERDLCPVCRPRPKVSEGLFGDEGASGDAPTATHAHDGGGDQ